MPHLTLSLCSDFKFWCCFLSCLKATCVWMTWRQPDRFFQWTYTRRVAPRRPRHWRGSPWSTSCWNGAVAHSQLRAASLVSLVKIMYCSFLYKECSTFSINKKNCKLAALVQELSPSVDSIWRLLILVIMYNILIQSGKGITQRQPLTCHRCLVGGVQLAWLFT